MNTINKPVYVFLKQDQSLVGKIDFKQKQQLQKPQNIEPEVKFRNRIINQIKSIFKNLMIIIKLVESKQLKKQY